MNELKPCPFCGSSDITSLREGTSRASCIMVCEDCGCSLESNEIGFGRMWNMRTESIELATLREQVKVLREACQSGIDALGGIMNYYGTGLQVINWHLNGDSEPFDNFIDNDEIGCALDSLSEAIEQTKPKDDV